MSIILPSDPTFYETLAHPPKVPISHDTNFICRVGSYVLEPVGKHELDDYLEGGEYDQRMNEWEEVLPSTPLSTILYLPESMRIDNVCA